MKQTYQEFLEESTNIVKAKRNLGKIILLSTYFFIWVVTAVIFWNTNGPATAWLDITFRWIMLPLLLLVSTITVAKNNYWGKGKWLCVLGAAITFLTVPYTEYAEEPCSATFTFRFPNFEYMMIGIIISLCGIGIGIYWKKRATLKEKL